MSGCWAGCSGRHRWQARSLPRVGAWVSNLCVGRLDIWELCAGVACKAGCCASHCQSSSAWCLTTKLPGCVGVGDDRAAIAWCNGTQYYPWRGAMPDRAFLQWTPPCCYHTAQHRAQDSSAPILPTTHLQCLVGLARRGVAPNGHDGHCRGVGWQHCCCLGWQLVW
jgi:hypothetical protein